VDNQRPSPASISGEAGWGSGMPLPSDGKPTVDTTAGPGDTSHQRARGHVSGQQRPTGPSEQTADDRQRPAGARSARRRPPCYCQHQHPATARQHQPGGSTFPPSCCSPPTRQPSYPTAVATTGTGSCARPSNPKRPPLDAHTACTIVAAWPREPPPPSLSTTDPVAGRSAAGGCAAAALAR
jgi:hypothetical protein